jgi:hypothetical protein
MKMRTYRPVPDRRQGGFEVTNQRGEIGLFVDHAPCASCELKSQ